MIIVKGKDNAPATAPPATVLSTSASIKGTLSVDSVSSCLPEAYTAPPAVVATTVSTVGDHLASWFTLFLVFILAIHARLFNTIAVLNWAWIDSSSSPIPDTSL